MDDVFERWPFLRGIELPKGMWWKVSAGEPCIGNNSDLWFAWVTMYNWADGHAVYDSTYQHKVSIETTLEECCQALANMMWVIGDKS